MILISFGKKSGIMRVKVRFFTRIRELTNRREEEVETRGGITLQELLGLLEKNYGEEFRSYVREGVEIKKGSIQFLVNGRNTRFLNDLETRLKDGDVIALLPPSGGG
jgi:molybdopterin synthase sulfur carrier subunit